jgi:GxxExxY protein
VVVIRHEREKIAKGAEDAKDAKDWGGIRAVSKDTVKSIFERNRRDQQADGWAMLSSEVGDQLDDLARNVIGCAIEVHRHLGPGYVESVYENALCLELGTKGLQFERQVAFATFYKGEAVGYGRLDVLVERSLVLELKATEAIIPIHVSQLVSYLRATRNPLGLLINFNVPRLREGIRRIAFSGLPAR